MENSLVFIFSYFLLCYTAISSSPSLHRFKPAISKSFEAHLSSKSPPPPTTFFEVSRPILVPKTPPCSILALQHDFAYTLEKPPATVVLSASSHCPSFRRHIPSLVVLEWSAACSGRQFDRIFGIWLAGVELLRSCTAEPRPNGILWNVQKDITRYASLFSESQTLVVNLGNIVDEIYTGIYHANVSFHFYFDLPPSKPQAKVHAFFNPADVIIPISKSLPLNDALWFQIQNSTDLQGKEISIPRNAYRAVLEVYVSFHSKDEFWYTNPPDSYISENNISSTPGNGAFREVIVTIDNNIVGAVWPFTVIYTGGFNPLLWRPISGIGSFNLPSYDIEITPFLGQILDGKKHSFKFGVTNALDVWFIDANLHLWVDSSSLYTKGGLITHESPALTSSLAFTFKGFDGYFDTITSRMISSTGWVESSHGNTTTNFIQSFNFTNKMKISANGSIQEVNQSIFYHSERYAKYSSSNLISEHVYQNFPLYLYTETEDLGNETSSYITNVTLGFNENKFLETVSDFFISKLENTQSGQGILVMNGSSIANGTSSTQQSYRYGENEGCYYRNIGSKNYTIIYDHYGGLCTIKKDLGFL